MPTCFFYSLPGHGHVNPTLEHRGMLVVWNPLDHEVTRTLQVPLYYTGLRESAAIYEQGENVIEQPLARDYSVELEVVVPAGGMNWYLIQ